MSITDELDERGAASTALLLTLSLVSANRGAQLLFSTDLVTTIFGPWANVVFAVAGVVGLVTLVELLTNAELIPDDWRL